MPMRVVKMKNANQPVMKVSDFSRRGEIEENAILKHVRPQERFQISSNDSLPLINKHLNPK